MVEVTAGAMFAPQPLDDVRTAIAWIRSVLATPRVLGVCKDM